MWARNRCHPRDELDEDAQDRVGHSRLFSPPELTRVWQLTLHLLVISLINVSFHHMVKKRLEEIHVV
jgi:hypothetical protein